MRQIKPHHKESFNSLYTTYKPVSIVPTAFILSILFVIVTTIILYIYIYMYMYKPVQKLQFQVFIFLKLILVTFKLIIFELNNHLTTKPSKLVNLIFH